MATIIRGGLLPADSPIYTGGSMVFTIPALDTPATDERVDCKATSSETASKQPASLPSPEQQRLTQATGDDTSEAPVR